MQLFKLSAHLFHMTNVIYARIQNFFLVGVLCCCFERYFYREGFRGIFSVILLCKFKKFDFSRGKGVGSWPTRHPLDPRIDTDMIQERYGIIVIFYSSCFDNERNRTIQRKLSISHQPLRHQMEMVLPFDRRHPSHGFLLCFRSRHISFLCNRLTDNTCHRIYKIRRQQEQNYSRKYLYVMWWN